MALSIPKSSVYTIKKGSSGAAAFAVQRVCNKLGYPTSEDASFGPQTETNVKKVQTRLNVTPDGIVGPGTQQAIAKLLTDRQEAINDTPSGLLSSQISYESGGLLAAVNSGTPGGIDCGITQRRVYDYQYGDDAAIKRAFDAQYQIDLLGDSLRNLHDIFMPRAGVKGNSELAWRLAVLNHNYPSAADSISRYGLGGLSAYWNRDASWVTTWGLKFPDGERVSTPLEWAQRYALGNKSHNEPGQAVKSVKSWV